MAFTLVTDTRKETKDSGDFDTSVYTIPTPGSGNMLIMLVQYIPGLSVTSISGGGVTWVKAIQRNATGWDAEIWYGLNSSGSGTSITMENSGAGDIPVNILEFSNGAGTSTVVLDGTAGNSPAGVNITSSAITPTASREGVLVACWARNGAATYTSGPTGGFSNTSGGSNAGRGGYQIVASTSGSYTYSIVYTNNYATADLAFAAFTLPAAVASEHWVTAFV